MPNISTYATKTTPVGADKVAGTDSVDGSTKNFTLAGIVALAPAGGGGGGRANFVAFVASKPGVAMPIDQIYSEASTLLNITHRASAGTGATGFSTGTVAAYCIIYHIAGATTTAIGTIGYAAGGSAGRQAGTFDWTAGTRGGVTITAGSLPRAIAAGDILRVTTPSGGSPIGSDATLSDISWSINVSTP